MPVRPMTQEEKEEMFGNGVVIFGMRPPNNSEMNSSKSDSKQNLPEKIQRDSHDEWLTSQSDEQLHNLVRNLKPLLQKSLKTESDEATLTGCWLIGGLGRENPHTLFTKTHLCYAGTAGEQDGHTHIGSSDGQ